jgi:tRNA(fMet)-specific endonuclease VapC
MKRIIIDTNFYVAFKKRDDVAVATLRKADYIAVNSVILGELLAGFRCGTREKQNREELDLFFDSPRVNFLSVDDETAEFFTQIFADLKQNGRPIPTNDLWIAASAMQHGLALATFDDHFKSIGGLLLAYKI